MKQKESFEVLASRIHERFDWQKVHTAMMATGWTWALGKDSEGRYMHGVPSLETIKREVLRILKNAHDSGGAWGSGGFTAGWENDELFLKFTLEETTSEE